MIIVSNTSPINYLILIGEIDLLPSPELDIASQGDTVEEARNNLIEAI